MTRLAEPALAPASGARLRLTLASLAVLLAAADTYVVVLALPDIMLDIGIGLDELQRATPILSVFLLGYVAVLPLIGRLSDVVGRAPVLLGCLAAFALGSAVTAVGESLTVVVVGRFLQGLGGGGLVPVTLALVADLWPVGRRGVPLGVVGAVQELGSVVGPLYGAAIVAVAGWRWIFWVNLAFATGLALLLRGRSAAPPGERGSAAGQPLRPVDPVGTALLAVAVLLGVVALAAPDPLARSVTVGGLLIPVIGSSPALSPLALAAGVAAAGWLLRTLSGSGGRRPVVPLLGAPRAARSVDLVGGVLLAGVLGCIVLTFGAVETRDPQGPVLHGAGPVLLALAAALTVLFVVHERRSPAPLVPLPDFRPAPAWGALAVSFALGGALMAALVDVPFFARATRYPDSQVDAALVLVRFLAALPVGAVVGGLVCERLTYRGTAATGMLLAAGSFVLMARWDADALAGFGATVVLVAAGFGFGLAIAPVNAAVLAAVRPGLVGLASALVVVARMSGMLVGLSLLTAIGLRRFAAATADLQSPLVLCPDDPGDCPAYDDAVLDAVLDQLATVFAGAAVFALVAAVLALGLLRRPPAAKRGRRLVGSASRAA